MIKNRIKYKSGYKYQLYETYTIKTDIKPNEKIETRYLVLDIDGTLTIKAGYCWDGATGVPDSNKILRGSLIHDAFYQLMRLERLDRNIYRIKADEQLKKDCKLDGMGTFKAWCVYRGVRLFGGSASNPDNRKKIKVAP